MVDDAKARKRMGVWVAICFALVLVLFFVFGRASIEVGEERFWFFYYLAIVPPVAAVAIALALANVGWLTRLCAGLVVLAVMPVILWQVPRAADYVYENPSRFRALLPAIATLEKVYLAIAPTDQEHLARHETKMKQWREIGD